ncbi:hypothetical protein OHD16_06615 [Sphingobacterium sp. ML3W]|uniref:hypothetical protein n=1 Tax=Sphingobacterium sp. ML3W TaxID=1538644 RepID=UPI00249A8C6B|nr:hypothetical protein [Sphingobacterium sp. ML3W]WFA79641.1 hypothetical protein OGI71_26855 [Sphingobacterium sp. ML3W]
MGEITFMLTEEQIKQIIIETIATYKIDEVLAKNQLTFTEGCKYYGPNRFRKWIKSGLLKPESQNGKTNKVYYSHKKIIQLSKQWRHDLNEIS